MRRVLVVPILSAAAATSVFAADDEVSLKGHGHKDGAVHVAVSEDGSRVLSAGRFKDPVAVVAWDVPGKRKLHSFPLKFGCDGVFIHPKGKVAGWLEGSYRPEVVVVDLDSGAEVRRWRVEAPDEDSARSIALSGDGRLVAIGTSGRDRKPDGKDSEPRLVKVYELETGKCIHSLRAHDRAVMHVEFTRDGETVMSTGADLGLRRWSTKDGKELPTLGKGGGDHAVGYLGSSISPDGRWVLGNTASDSLVVWDGATGAVKRAIPVPGKLHVRRTAFSRDGKAFFVAGDSGTVWAYDVESGRNLKRLQADPKEIHSLSVSVDGSTLVTGGSAYLKVWRVGPLLQ